jgi:predicted MPP superfamily phosphohydrolase
MSSPLELLKSGALDLWLGLAFASLLIPIWVVARFGAAAARLCLFLWPAITLGALLLFLYLSRVVLVSVEWPVASAVGMGLYAWMLVHLAGLAVPRMRGKFYAAAVLVPGTVLTAACFLAVPLGAGAWIAWGACVSGTGRGTCQASLALGLAPWFLAASGLFSSIRPRKETVRIRPSAERPTRPQRLPCERRREVLPNRGEPGVLRVAQVTDPHLGGLWSVAGLRSILERIAAREPDLVLLTGDFLALEGMFSPGALAQALAPLRDRPGTCFAALGNHDLDAIGEVRRALSANGIRLLVDQRGRVKTRVGPVEVIGIAQLRSRDFAQRREHLRKVLGQTAAAADEAIAYRICLLHDPSRFADIDPEAPGAPDLVLSGHVHGGQLGLVALGLPWTILTGTRWPDHGLWGLGRCRLYAHRGTGIFGFPLRIGVPGEESLLEIEVKGGS